MPLEYQPDKEEITANIETAIEMYHRAYIRPPQIAIVDSQLLRILEDSGCVAGNTISRKTPSGEEDIRILTTDKAKRLNSEPYEIPKSMQLPLVLCREGRLGIGRRGLKRFGTYDIGLKPVELIQAK